MKRAYMMAVMLMMFAAGCSVKESRDGCPCRLVMDFTDVDTVAVRDVRLYVDDGQECVCDMELEACDFFPECSFSVPRSRLYVNVYELDGGFLEHGEGIRIPYGEDCPLLYMHSAVVDADGELLEEKVALHKNHCLVTLYLDKQDSFAYDLCVKGNVDGYCMDGTPHQGDFSHVLEADDSQVYKAVLPRQVDPSLVLEIDDGTDVLKRFALGEYIVAGGYDWEALDLEDVTVHVDWAMTTVSISVSGWDWVYECEIVI